MRRTIHNRRHLHEGQRYGVFRDGIQVNDVRLVIKEGVTGYLAEGEHDPLEEVDLRDWLDERTIIPLPPESRRRCRCTSEV